MSPSTGPSGCLDNIGRSAIQGGPRGSGSTVDTLARICLAPLPSAEGLPLGSKPDKGRQPEDGAGARPGRVTALPLPAEWRGPERVSGRAGDTERPEASLISLLRVADSTLPLSWPGAGRTPRAVDSEQSRPVWWQFLVSAPSFYASTPPIFSYRRCPKHCTLPPAPSPHYRDPQGS